MKTRTKDSKRPSSSRKRRGFRIPKSFDATGVMAIGLRLPVGSVIGDRGALGFPPQQTGSWPY